MIVHPSKNYLLIELIEEKGESAGGLVLPDAKKEAPRKGVIKAVGPKVNAFFLSPSMENPEIFENTEILADLTQALNGVVGKIALIKKWGGTDLEIDGVPHLLIEDVDVLALIEEDK